MENNKKYFKVNKQSFAIRLLTKKDINSSYGLLKQVAKEMQQKGFEKFIIHKPKEKIEEIFTNPMDKMAGVFLLDENKNEIQLVAEMGYFSVADDVTRNETCKVLSSFHANAIKNNEIYIIGSVCVDPKFRGNGFFKILNNFLETFVKKENRVKYSVAAVEITNFNSLKAFLKDGFISSQIVLDSFDKTKFWLLKKLDDNIKKFSEDEVFSLYIKDKDYKSKLTNIFAKEYIVFDFNNNSEELQFIKSSEIKEIIGAPYKK